MIKIITNYTLSLALPNMIAIRRKLAAAAEIVYLACGKIVRKTEARVKMRRERLAVGIYRHKHTLVLEITLQNALPVRQHRHLNIAVLERLALAVRLRKPCDKVGKLVPLGSLKARTERGVAVFLLRLSAPLAAVINAGNTRHTEKHGVNERQMLRLGEYRSHAGNIVIINKTEQVQPAELAPVLGTETVFQRMAYLEHIHAVEARIQTLIALVIRHGMQHFGVSPALILTVYHLADKEEILFQAVGEAAQALHEIEIEQISHIEPYAVDAEILYPVFYTIHDMVGNGGVFEIELNKVVMTLPAFVPKTVVIIAVAVEIDVEPVLVRRIPLLFANVTELREAASDMIENAVQYDLNAFFVQSIADLLEILVSAETGIYLAVIAGVVAVSVAFEHGREVHGVAAELFDMVNPVKNLQYAVFENAVILERRSAEAQGVYLIKDSLITPVSSIVSHFKSILSLSGADP